MIDDILVKVKELAGLAPENKADDTQLMALIDSQIADLEFQGISKRTPDDVDYGLYCDIITRMVLPLLANNFKQSDNYNKLLDQMITRLSYADFRKRLKP